MNSPASFPISSTSASSSLVRGFLPRVNHTRHILFFHKNFFASEGSPRQLEATSTSADSTHLLELRIQDYALVRDQRVKFHPGLNVITGQSGSGKSVLLDAIAQLCGAPVREECIRHGSKHAALRGVFHISDASSSVVNAILQRYGAFRAFESNENTSRQNSLFSYPTAGETQNARFSFSAKTLVLERRLMNSSDDQREIGVSKLASNLRTSPRARSICLVNKTVVPVKALRELGHHLVDFNGQGSASALDSEGSQRSLLDAIAGTHESCSYFNQLALSLATQREESDKLIDMTSDDREELNKLIRAVSTVDPYPGEDIKLKIELRKMERTREVAEMCSEVLATLKGQGDDAAGNLKSGILDDLSGVFRQVKAIIKLSERAANNPEISMLEEALLLCSETVLRVAEMKTLVTNYSAEMHYDPLHREECTIRLRKIDRLCRTLCVENATQACEASKVAKMRLGAADILTETRSRVSQEIREKELEVAKVGLALSRARRIAGTALSRTIADICGTLAMESCRFEVVVAWEEALHPQHQSETDVSSHSISKLGSLSSQLPSVFVEDASELGERKSSSFVVREGGFDRVSFLFASGLNEPLRSISRVGSGGEKARTFLALKITRVMISEDAEFVSLLESDAHKVELPKSLSRSPVAIMSDSNTKQQDIIKEIVHSSSMVVFDELDSGVGARIGTSIGSALRKLSTKGGQQVLCVTHLPQVAAYSDAHVCVSKDEIPISRKNLPPTRKNSETRTGYLESSQPNMIIIEELGDESRIVEISSMLGLDRIGGNEQAVRLLAAARLDCSY